jgi:hypothetical protein
MTPGRLGHAASVVLVAIGIAYVLVLAVGMARHGLREPITDPILAVMEILTLLSAPPMVVLMAAMHGRASEHRKVHALTALVFAALFAGTTSAVHFVELTAARQAGGGGLVWPSTAYAAELLAWDIFLGLALLFAASTFEGQGHERAVQRWMRISGVLCLVGTIGPVVGNMRLQLIGVLGYAVVLPVVFFLLARLFGQDSRGVAASDR